MQTFLPLDSFTDSARVLDYRRLGNQRVECVQILNSLEGRSKGWLNHPCTKMWRGYEMALRAYFNCVSREWEERGYMHNMGYFGIDRYFVLPPWFGDEAFHSSHRAALLHKDENFYKEFNWSEFPDLNYVWPAVS